MTVEIVIVNGADSAWQLIDDCCIVQALYSVEEATYRSVALQHNIILVMNSRHDAVA